MNNMWAENSVFYQIYPLGAAGAPFENDHNPAHRLRQFENWVDHLKKLNVDAVLFNPLFESATHGYDTTDYRKVDTRLGSEEDLKHLIQTLHENDIKVIFDAVFNHVGREFPPFVDVLKNREASPYKDWFRIYFDGNNGYNDGLSYENWEGYDALVKLNQRNPEVVQYHLDTVDYWKNELGADGLRLDVAYCLNPDFLRALHNHVKTQDPEFFLLGETLHGDYNQWCNDQMLDSVTNYECYKGLYSAFNSANLFEIVHSFNRQFGSEPWCLYTGKHLMCFVDNHDVNRIASQLTNKKLLPALYALMFCMPGIPCVYYGSEWGTEGIKQGNDLSIRPAFEMPQENELTDIIAKLAAVHKNSEALCQGDYRQIVLSNEWAVIERSCERETVWLALNISSHPVDMNVNFNGTAVDLMTEEPVSIANVIHLEPESFQILKIR